MSFVYFEHCYLTKMLVECCFVCATVVWYDFVFASIIIVEISTFIMQQQLMNFVMLASIVFVKSTLCVLASDISIVEKIVSSPLFTVTC
jgi:hypothetical protein